jgi:Lipase (class 3)
VLPSKSTGELSQRSTRSRTLVASATPSLGVQSTPLDSNSTSPTSSRNTFSLTTALFAAGLAFDVYAEPPANSSRYERGSGGLTVGFCSRAYTKSLYAGLVQIIVHNCTDLPSLQDLDQENLAETVVTGQGMDPTVLVAAVERPKSGPSDLVRLQQAHPYHQGVLDLQGAAHIGRCRTAWASVNRLQSERAAKSSGRAIPYYDPPAPSSWVPLSPMIPAAAYFPDEPPFYLYVQDPASVSLVWSVLDADQLFGSTGRIIGSAITKLTDLIPSAAWSPQQWVRYGKDKVLASLPPRTPSSTSSAKQDTDRLVEALSNSNSILAELQAWNGIIPLTSKPRKKDKNNQVVMAAAAGAYVAGPVGAAAGALLGSFYESTVQGKIGVAVRYLPMTLDAAEARPTKKYVVYGGMPGITWGAMFQRYQLAIAALTLPASVLAPITDADDLELCFFVNHEVTGASCAVYRSIQQKYIVVSFRGTCVPIDLLTDATIVQDAWMEGDDVKEQDFPKVHAGFRASLNSISRRLKELVLAATGPGDSFSNYHVLVTGHSLGGALATLFTADVGQYGFDAGRGLPQLEPSEPWWTALTNTIMGQQALTGKSMKEPPRPKSLRMYNFGSPRVGNAAFAVLFDALVEEGYIIEAYRVVNGDDVVARMPRTVNALVFGQVGYDHVGKTVLVSQPPENESEEMDARQAMPLLWVEGESDNSQCPVRDGTMLSSPVADGTLLGDIIAATKSDVLQKSGSGGLPSWNQLSEMAGRVADRVKSVTASDVASVLGIDRQFSDREMKLISSLLQGRALAHHLEDEYYSGMGRAAGLRAKVGEDLIPLDQEA